MATGFQVLVIMCGMNTLQGSLSAPNARIAIVASRWNEDIVQPLIEGAVRALLAAEVREEDITLIRVPGAFEIPLMLGQLAESEQYEGLIALGCVVRGETTHYDTVSNEVARGMMNVMQDYGIPVGYGVLCVENMAQAVARASKKDDTHNKGVEAADAVIEMLNLFAQLD